ncbi:hypothetical protein Ade02nite_15050 [Paractinoplanes deccanensis]|uniref:Gp5/Type VI secretion system Vgr protein OB-fold domain-containing protein n=1 Tax=Paractinoplanes deccanensis TaxID=113561 RepID=A0ABQ3XYP3_9ACTN|nr:phage baseplate assembly protein V [Actinoplanes deccanensis]GID72864.1 hypothetical protein Ade02nite_15050 [Actinoplanes deccanensis]
MTADRWYGLFPATVRTLAGDPEKRQRIEVSLDWLPRSDGGGPVTAWATVVSPYAGADQGLRILPEIGSTVVVGFQAGYPDRPYVLGGTWNGTAAMPDEPTDANDLRVLRTRSGTRLEFDDTPGAVAVRLSVAGPDGPMHRLTLDDAAGTVTIESASGATITLDASGGVAVNAASTVDITAAAVNVHAATSTFDGLVTCEGLVAKGGGVVSPSYTPGVGNVW